MALSGLGLFCGCKLGCNYECVIIYWLGIIPGPHEPQRHINTFLQQLVVLKLWESVPIDDVTGGTQYIVELCVTSAVQKITQFLGRSGMFTMHIPRRTVSRVLLSESRKHKQVVEQAKEYQLATLKAAATAVAQKNGVRYSELIRLPYFDIVRMTTTDPMHTLFGQERNRVKPTASW